MVEYIENRLSLIYAAIADPTRRAILAHLAQREARITELAAPFTMSLNAVSKHVRVLERAGLVRRHIKGREHHLSLEAAPLQTASAWLDTYRQFREERLDALETFLQQLQPRKPQP